MAASRDWSHETALEPVPSSAALAREFVSKHLVANHLAHLVEDVRLVASELATNAVAHAQTPFVVALRRTKESVWLAVIDESAKAPVHSSAGPTDLGGRGMTIVESLSESWGSSTDPHGTKSVWASFAITEGQGLNPVG